MHVGILTEKACGTYLCTHQVTLEVVLEQVGGYCEPRTGANNPTPRDRYDDGHATFIPQTWRCGILGFGWSLRRPAPVDTRKNHGIFGKNVSVSDNILCPISIKSICRSGHVGRKYRWITPSRRTRERRSLREVMSPLRFPLRSILRCRHATPARPS
jgi:hypothetical protein